MAKRYNYEEAFIKAGHGKWQYILLVVCGWANASDAIEILCVSFIMPLIRTDMDVSYASLSGLTIALFCGMMIGGYLWGSMADRYGRRKTLSMSLAVNAIFGILSGLSPNYLTFLMFRFLSGLGAGGSLPVCFTYFGECQQTKKRGAMISALAMCWMIGNLLSGLLAWLVLPTNENVIYFSPYGQQWRLFTILCGIPSISSCFLISYLPESPRFLYISGRTVQSIEVLSMMFSWNHGRPKTEFSVNEQTPEEDCYLSDEEEMLLNTEDAEHPNTEKVQSTYSSIKTGFSSWKNQMLQIFSPVRRVHSTAIMAISVSVAFGGYGMGMWMPVLMNRAELYDGSPCQASGGASANLTTDAKSGTVYVDLLIGFIGQLPSNIAIILLMDRIGSKRMLIYSAFLTAISVFLFWFTSSKATVIAMNALFNAISVGCWDALDVLLVEVYPTSIRSAATGNSSGISRLGSILGTAVFGMYMDASCSVPIITVFFAYALAGFAGLKLPDLQGKNLL